MKKVILGIVTLALFLSIEVIRTAIAAGTVSGIFNMQLVIGSGCAVTGGTQTSTQNNFGTINFGTASTTTNVIAGQLSGLSINCTNSLAYIVSLDNGLYVISGTQRRMNNGASAYISYNLYKEAARQNLWTSAVTLTGTGTGSATPLVVYASIPSQTTPIAGTYTDTVTMTVTW